MQELKLAPGIKNLLGEFIRGLKDIYKDDLVSVILYGSAASGEFVSQHSNLNLLVCLRSAELNELLRAQGLVNRPKFKQIQPLFFTKDYVNTSSDVFPIEFLDMKENYLLLEGTDILKGLSIDIKNLRFQCEHELKAKLINLRQAFVRFNKNKRVLRDILLKSFTSIIHIVRNVIRIKNKQPVYLKEDFIKQIKEELPVTVDVWEKILAAKNKQIKLNPKEVDGVFIDFVGDLEKIINVVDTL